MPIAEIISVGTELLFGEIVDSNAAFLARELGARGVTLHRKTVVGDNLDRLRAAIELALGRADLLLLGGGLGPTDDDLTREAIAAALNETPQVDEAQLTHLRGLFEARGRAMPDLNRKQAWLIPSAEALPNPVGTAPGWFVRTTWNGQPKLIAALPGPPREMRRMWTEQVLPRLPFRAAQVGAVQVTQQRVPQGVRREGVRGVRPVGAGADRIEVPAQDDGVGLLTPDQRVQVRGRSGRSGPHPFRFALERRP